MLIFYPCLLLCLLLYHHLYYNLVELGRGYIDVGAEDTWEKSVPSPKFCCEAETALKI